MKGLIRAVLSHALALYFTALIIPGLILSQSFENYIVVAVLLTVFVAIMKPLLAVILVPFNLITLGFFSSVMTLISLFIISVFYQGLAIQPFEFAGLRIMGIQIPSFQASLLLSYLIISVIIFSIVRTAGWLTED